MEYNIQRNEDKIKCYDRPLYQRGMSIDVITDLASEPVTITEAKAHLRIDGTDDDTWLTSNITTARVMMENYAGISFGAKTINVFFERYTFNVKLPMPYVDEVTAVNINGEAATLNDNYKVTQGKRLEMYTGYENLSVTYTTKAFSDLPAGLQQSIKSCILCQLAHLYTHKSDENFGLISGEAMGCIGAYKVLNVF